MRNNIKKFCFLTLNKTISSEFYMITTTYYIVLNCDVEGILFEWT